MRDAACAFMGCLGCVMRGGGSDRVLHVLLHPISNSLPFLDTHAVPSPVATHHTSQHEVIAELN
jgi:hypothetical protein